MNKEIAKKQMFDYISKLDKIKQLLDIIDATSKEGTGQIILRPKDNFIYLSTEEMIYLREEKGFIVYFDMKEEAIRIKWLH